MSTVDLRLGDCLEVLPTLGHVDAVITDPPYGLGKRMQGGTWGADKQEKMKWDKATAPKAIGLLLGLAPIVVIWGGNYYKLPITRCWLSWYKPDSPPTMADFELAWTNQDRNSMQLSHSIAATNKERVDHPTQKPVRLMVWCIQKMGVPEGGTILDPFMGSGTTGVACVKLGRNFIGIERDPAYFAIAERRIAQAQAQLSLPLFSPAPQPHLTNPSGAE